MPRTRRPASTDREQEAGVKRRLTGDYSTISVTRPMAEVEVWDRCESGWHVLLGKHSSRGSLTDDNDRGKSLNRHAIRRHASGRKAGVGSIHLGPGRDPRRSTSPPARPPLAVRAGATQCVAPPCHLCPQRPSSAHRASRVLIQGRNADVPSRQFRRVRQGLCEMGDARREFHHFV